MISEFHIYYVKGRVFEWTFALSTLFAGLECLYFDNVISFGAFRWLLLVLSQKSIGTFMLFMGWIRLAALMFNGQMLFGRKIGWAIRGICAVLSASLWSQFALSLLTQSLENGVPSLGLPFWTMFTLAELLIAYQVGTEWKKV